MKPISAALESHLAGQVTTLAVCWRVERRDGVLILGTEHDQDITIPPGDFKKFAGTYRAQTGITGSDVASNTGLAVDNMEVSGAVDTGAVSIYELSAAEIESGLFDDAEVSLFLVNWLDPDGGELMLRDGTIGEISRTSEGQYRTELRGLKEKLSQIVTRTYGASCDAELGDARCGYAFAPGEVTTGVVDAVTSNRQFAVTLADAQLENYYNGGLLTWTSGENDTFSMELKQDTFSDPPEFLLYLPMPRDVAVGDTFSLMPGCDKSVSSCQGKFDNLVNFRGHGYLVPGKNQVMAFATQQRKKKKKNKNLFNNLAQGWAPP